MRVKVAMPGPLDPTSLVACNAAHAFKTPRCRALFDRVTPPLNHDRPPKNRVARDRDLAYSRQVLANEIDANQAAIGFHQAVGDRSRNAAV